MAGCGAAPGTGCGVNANEPTAPCGMPMYSNGAGVPRPTLTTVGSNGHNEGYSAMDSGVGKFGEGAICGYQASLWA